MKEIVIWFVLMIPKPACIEADKKENFIKYVDPKTNAPVELRVRGEEPSEKSLIKFSATVPDIHSDECYDVYMTSTKPRWALMPPAPKPAKKAKTAKEEAPKAKP